ncbi:MAG: sigma-70 family RNA polymerase sigma factor [Lentisphaerae bacterium]|nr:sigma-70 family RNA polymerase sigma factor [Lentisphaerota bacterium]
MPETDHALWVEGALETYEKPLLRYALRWCRGDVERARDAVQDTFLRLCRQPRQRVEGHLAQWLYTVCRNRAIELLRKEARMDPLSDTDLATRPSGGADPAGQADHGDRQAALARLLADLPERQQELIRLKFQEDLSYKEISSIMALSVSNVGFLLHTSLQTLRRRLRELEAPSPEGRPS